MWGEWVLQNARSCHVDVEQHKCSSHAHSLRITACKAKHFALSEYADVLKEKVPFVSYTCQTI